MPGAIRARQTARLDDSVTSLLLPRRWYGSASHPWQERSTASRDAALPNRVKVVARKTGAETGEKEIFMERLMDILDLVFGCHHGHLSRVFSIDGRTYRVCSDCGAKFNYSLDGMCIERKFRVLDGPHVTSI
jgi:hypothetical protein